MALDQIAQSQCIDVIELLKIFLEERKEDSFVSLGNLDCLTYILYENISHKEDNICRLAAENGHLDCLAYAHEQGCPMERNYVFGNRKIWSVRLFDLCT